MKKLYPFFVFVYLIGISYGNAQLQMPYTAAISVNVLPNTYWIVAQTNLDDAHQTGLVTFLGYNSKADYLAGEQSVGSHQYPITPALYQQYYVGAVDHIAAGYAMAQAVQNVIVTPAVLGTDGSIQTPATTASFFNNATVVGK